MYLSIKGTLCQRKGRHGVNWSPNLNICHRLPGILIQPWRLHVPAAINKKVAAATRWLSKWNRPSHCICFTVKVAASMEKSSLTFLHWDGCLASALFSDENAFFQTIERFFFHCLFSWISRPPHLMNESKIIQFICKFQFISLDWWFLQGNTASSLSGPFKTDVSLCVLVLFLRLRLLHYIGALHQWIEAREGGGLAGGLGLGHHHHTDTTHTHTHTLAEEMLRRTLGWTWKASIDVLAAVYNFSPPPPIRPPTH